MGTQRPRRLPRSTVSACAAISAWHVAIMLVPALASAQAPPRDPSRPKVPPPPGACDTLAAHKRTTGAATLEEAFMRLTGRTPHLALEDAPE